MKWTDEHDKILVREVLLFEPFRQSHGSVERGKAWENTSESLNGLPNPIFCVSQRSVRDHLKALQANLHISRFDRAGGANWFEHAQKESLHNIYMFARS